MDLGDDSIVIELGPGTGPFTKEILRIQGEHKNTTYLGLEAKNDFVAVLREHFPDHKNAFVHASADTLVEELKKRNIKHADTVISGLPWAIFPEALQRTILEQVKVTLRSGGKFCTFAYLQGMALPAGQRFKRLLAEVFEEEAEASATVWSNLPPAFVYRCEKKPASAAPTVCVLGVR